MKKYFAILYICALLVIALLASCDKKSTYNITSICSPVVHNDTLIVPGPRDTVYIPPTPVPNPDPCNCSHIKKSSERKKCEKKCKK